MSKGRPTKEELMEISNKMIKSLVCELLDSEQKVNPVDVVCVLAIMHRSLFANIERQSGIEQARKDTGFLVGLIKMTLKNGAWDYENECVK